MVETALTSCCRCGRRGPTAGFERCLPHEMEVRFGSLVVGAAEQRRFVTAVGFCAHDHHGSNTCNLGIEYLPTDCYLIEGCTHLSRRLIGICWCTVVRYKQTGTYLYTYTTVYTDQNALHEITA